MSNFLAINVGSSSLKASVFEDSHLKFSYRYENIGKNKPFLTVDNLTLQHTINNLTLLSHLDALADLATRINAQIDFVGHRVVFAGPNIRSTTEVNEQLLQQMGQYADFDPEHMPYIISVIERAKDIYSGARHFAVIDNSLFSELPQYNQRLSLPSQFHEAGLLHYGYHGLAYQSNLHQLINQVGEIKDKKIVMAHLGSGCSVSAFVGNQPVNCSMSFSPSSGVMMSSRSGDLDPSAVLFLQQKFQLDSNQIKEIVNHQSGLVAVSELSADMRELLEARTSNQKASLAIKMFCLSIKRQIGAYCFELGGIDYLVFSGGIAERSAYIREEICSNLSQFGIELDHSLNYASASIISRDHSAEVLIISTNEQEVIVSEIQNYIN